MATKRKNFGDFARKLQDQQETPENNIKEEVEDEPKLSSVSDVLKEISQPLNTAFDTKFIRRDKLVFSDLNDYPIQKIEELADQILAEGLLHNIVVIYDVDSDTYKIVSGERRTRAIDNLLERFKNVIPDDSIEYKRYKHNVEPFKNGYPCKIKLQIDEGQTEEENLELREINEEIAVDMANESVRESDPIRTQQKIERMAYLIKRKDELINGRSTINVNKEISEKYNLNKSQVYTYRQVEKLIPELKELFANSKIILTDAANYSKLTEDEQKQIVDLINNGSDKKEINALYKSLDQAKKEIDEKKKEIEKISAEKIAVEKEFDSLKMNQNDLRKKIKKEIEAENPNDEKIEALQKEKAQIESEMRRIKKSQKMKEEEQQKEIESLKEKVSKQTNLMNKNTLMIKTQIELDELIAALGDTLERINQTLDRYHQVYTKDAEEKAPESYIEEIKDLLNKKCKNF